MDKLYYISQGNTAEEHLKNIKIVCESGVKWVQLRLKNVDMATYLETALECRSICDDFDVVMIINDNISIAQACQADGVHLGLSDESPKKAREILGNNFIIGATANTLNDCLTHIKNGVDYIGLGPYRFTETKKRLSPVLGITGYENIISKLNKEGHKVPIVAIGGILEKDFKNLYKTGISCVAVSGLLTGKNTDTIQNTIAKVIA
ncbi:MAG: thiamine phosphate synthase [Cellulophaga sp.]